jgi:hypothetical protein
MSFDQTGLIARWDAMPISTIAATVAAAIASVIALLLALVVKKLLGRWVNGWVIAGGAVLLACGLTVWIYRAFHVVVCY